ncbi:MAG: carboxypeptidase M32 [Pseudomonadota bacterium]
MKRVWQQATCLPADLVVAKIKVGSKCEHGWRTQRAENDWQGFLANFREVVAIGREEAGLRQQASVSATPYEALLELHCTGDSQAMIDSVFATLRAELPVLLNQVQEHQSSRQPRTLAGEYAIADQQALCEQLMQVLGFDFRAGRLDQSMHPFSTGVPGDLRITTRFRTSEFIEALNATAHEVGHASYEGGLPASLEGLPVGAHRNMCIHESQSLLFEKQVCVAKAFIGFFIDHVHHHLPQSKGLSGNTLWQLMTQVTPGYIRVEADEVCYPLHVLLRYEIESALINGDIEPDVIPDMWNEKMTEYLGLSTEGNYTDGCLQDIHWTDGAFGYFPSYTIGAVNSAQIFAALCHDHADWQARFANGDLSFIRQWLEEKIWSNGCQLSSQELMQHATGQKTNTDAYLAHLRNRYLNEMH